VIVHRISVLQLLLESGIEESSTIIKNWGTLFVMRNADSYDAAGLQEPPFPFQKGIA
jgi:hypothetical protein